MTTQAKAEIKVFVWDLPTRAFHWMLVALVLVSWFTGENEGAAALHRLSGEAVAGLLVFRIAWGIIGGENARFSSFVKGPGAIAAHIRDLASTSPKRWLGHNPIGGLSVVLMLTILAAIVITGLFSEGDHNAGPFAGALGGDAGEAHEVLFRALQAIVALHLAGVVYETFKTKDALVPAMIFGFKKRRAEEAASDAKRSGVPAAFAAVALGAAMTAYLASLPVPAPSAEAELEEEEDD